MFLGLIGVALASAYGLNAAVNDTKSYMIEKDLKKRGPIDVERDFEAICMICRIKRISYPSLIGGEDTKVLPEKGADNAYKFIMQEPLTDITDFNKFCKIYNQVRKQDLIKRQNTWDNEYQEIISSLSYTDEITNFKKRVIGISVDDNDLINKLYSETILGKIALKKGKAVFESGRSGRLHVWAFQGVSSLDSEKLYKACCRKVGVNLY